VRRDQEWPAAGAFVERAPDQTLTVQIEQIEDVVRHDEAGARPMLKSLKGGFAVLIERDDFTVQRDGFRRELAERCGNGSVLCRDVVLIARPQDDASADLLSDNAIAVPFDFVRPVLTNRQR
jgi:hypothetical protein